MRKEIYKIKCPKHIIFGDPQYFEEFKGAELKRLTVDYKPSEYFDTARLVLQEQPNQEFPDYMERSITLYLAPRQTMETYLKGMIFTSQKVAQKNIGVDTARYYFNVDGRDDEIKTEGDGWWGYFEEYYRQNGKDRREIQRPAERNDYGLQRGRNVQPCGGIRRDVPASV